MESPSIFELLKNGVHFGHRTSKWHPRMKPFIFTQRSGVHIIDLEKSLERLKAAQTYAKELAAGGRTILFVGTKRQAKELVKQAAEACGAPYFVERWLGGFLTNFETVNKVIERLRNLVADRESGALAKYTKKERLMFDREIEKLERIVGGAASMTKRPDALFVVDLKAEKTAVREARKMGLPVIAIADTNVDIDGVQYPIPANDDAVKSIAVVTKAISDAISEGKAEAERRKAEAAAAAASAQQTANA